MIIKLQDKDLRPETHIQPLVMRTVNNSGKTTHQELQQCFKADIVLMRYHARRIFKDQTNPLVKYINVELYTAILDLGNNIFQ